MKRLLSIALASSLTLACSERDPTEAGLLALQSGEFGDAADHLTHALEQRTPQDADYVQLSVDRCRALAHIDGNATNSSFATLLEVGGDRVSSGDLSRVVKELHSAHKYTAAVELAEVGEVRFPEESSITELKELAVGAIVKGEDPAEIAALRTMGYLGE